MTGVPLGVTVMPEYFQVEGVAAVFDRLAPLRPAALCTAPAVMAPADAATGAREPPADAGAGHGRLLDRPLWDGRRELYVRTAASFAVDRARYAGLRYQPPPPDPLTDRAGQIVDEVLAQCRRSGIEGQLQIMCGAPPGYRVQLGEAHADDQPLTAFGVPVRGRVDANLSLASPHLRAYMAALIGDLAARYPDLAGLRFDWPEYPPYHPDSLLFDFSPHAVAAGARLGVDAAGLAARLRQDAPGLRALLARPDLPARLAAQGLRAVLADIPVLAELAAWRRTLAADYARFLAQAAADASGGRLRTHFQGFPPPLDLLSGFDPATLDGFATDIGVKLYTMHWPMIEHAHATRLRDVLGLSGDGALAVVRAALGTDPAPPVLAQVRYPAPGDAHPADDATIAGKLRAARAGVHRARFWAMAHAYGPEADVLRRFRAARPAAGAVHVNRYGYLSDAKLAALARVMDEAA
jgi:hypothetical protein